MNNATVTAFCVGVLVLPILYGIFKIVSYLLEQYKESIRDEVLDEIARASCSNSSQSDTAVFKVDQGNYNGGLFWYGSRSNVFPAGYGMVFESNDPTYCYYIGYANALGINDQMNYDLVAVSM